MNARPPVLVTAALGLALVACDGPSDSAEDPAETVVLKTAMEQVVKPQSEIVVSVLIGALDDQPVRDVDPSKLADSDWEVMQTAAAALREAAVELRDDKVVVVADPAETLYEQHLPGMAGPPQVQARIDADPAGFSAKADALRGKADDWLAAIETRDASAMWRVALSLDHTCTECHEVFWTGVPEEEHDYGHIDTDDDHDDHDDHDD